MDNDPNTNGGAAAVDGATHTGDPRAPDHVGGDEKAENFRRRFLALERAVVDGLYGGRRSVYEEAHGIDTSDQGETAAS